MTKGNSISLKRSQARIDERFINSVDQRFNGLTQQIADLDKSLNKRIDSLK
jgi:hypothetical protein